MFLRPPSLDLHPKTYTGSVLALVGHLLGTTVIFMAFFTLCWLMSWLLHALHAIHHFPDEILTVLTTIEYYAVCASVMVCLVVLLGGTYRFCKLMFEVTK